MVKTINANRTNISYTVDVEISNVQLDNQIENEIIKLGKNQTIKGYRKGKAPLNVIRNHFQDQAKYEVFNKAIVNAIDEIAKEEKIKAIVQPEIDVKSKDGDENLVFTISYEFEPEFELTDISKLKLSKYKAKKVEDKAIEDTISNIKLQAIEWHDKDEQLAIDQKDRVNIDFTGYLKDEKVDEATANNVFLNIGSNQFIPGFEEGLIGGKKGDDKTLNLSFPKGYHNEKFKGQEIRFEVKINNIQTGKEPELTEEFIKKYETSGDLKKWKESIKKNLEQSEEMKARQQTKDIILKEFIDTHEIEIPPKLTQQFLAKKTPHKHDSTHDHNHEHSHNDEPTQEEKDKALDNAKNSIILRRLVEQEKLDVNPKEFHSQVQNLVKGLDPKYQEQAFKFFSEDKQKRNEIISTIIEDKIIDYLLSKAIVKEIDQKENS